ncbi:MAG: hydrogenase small subunit [Methanosarcinaceae archaeon]|nr:hydrogenase small subunit [Methanosarcinaceae archaeon]MDD4331447.1 hydrogenase small subunit [Methanosarcinaceae archaeon]
MNTGKKNFAHTLESMDFLKMDRRTFLKAVGAVGATAFLGTYKTEIVSALEFAETKIVWLHGAECTGCSESLLNGGNPDIVQAITKLNVNIAYHETLLAQQGIFVDGRAANTSELNSEILVDELIEEGNYILVVEGAIANGPDGSGRYCIIGNRTFKELFEKAAKNASAILAVGTCAAYGGINCAASAIEEITDFRGVDFKKEDQSKGMLQELGISKPVINIPGCPAHPDWILLTLGAVILGKIKIPDDLSSLLDKYGRPKVFFPSGHTVHENCPRRGFYDRGEFDTDISGDKCLWKLGCKAPYAHADCGLRKWNGGNSMCTQAGSPCIACVEPGFPDCARPLYVEAEDKGVLLGANIDNVSKAAVGAAALAAGAHAVRRMKGDE